MSAERIRQLETEIADLTRALATVASIPSAAAALQAQIAACEAELATLRHAATGPQIPTVTAGTANIATIQTIIYQFLGGAPSPDSRALLDHYLDALEADCQRLRLERIATKRQSGNETSTTPVLRLERVYTTLTTTAPPRSTLRKVRLLPAEQLHRLLVRAKRLDARTNRLQFDTLMPAVVPPQDVRILHINEIDLAEHGAHLQIARRVNLIDADVLSLPELFTHTSERLVEFDLRRPELVTEAIGEQPLLVLLGEPGAGKSTVLRYLALLLARQLRGQSATVPGWTQPPCVPILCPLASVTARMTGEGEDATAALFATLRGLLEFNAVRAGLGGYLDDALRSDTVLLLLDGLDELSADAAPGKSSIRALVADAIRTLARQLPGIRIVVTSRTLPYAEPGAWHLTAEDGWVQRTIAPLAFGQVRQFVTDWYAAIAEEMETLSDDEAAQRAADLIATLDTPSYARLREVIGSPLLLTMLAILHNNDARGLPRDLVQLYEEFVQLLLDRWEPVRSLTAPRPGLLERLGSLPGLELDTLREVLHELAFDAHANAKGQQARGIIDGDKLDGRLLRLFARFTPMPSTPLASFIEALRFDAGLLQELADRQYAFPHLTFQEYLAACRLSEHIDGFLHEAYTRWSGDDWQRWRVVLLLLVGKLRQRGGTRDVVRDALPWIEKLLAATANGQPKTVRQQHRDTLLAALSYEEIGGAEALVNTDINVEARLHAPLRTRIAGLLDTPDDQVGLDDRLALARVLAAVGDDRFPVTPDAWSTELQRRSTTFGQPNGYFCFIPSDTYAIGGWKGNETAAMIELAPYWLARLPVTVAQFRAFIDAPDGYANDACWSEDGLRWREDRGAPGAYFDRSNVELNHPVVAVSWYEAAAFCVWLTLRLAGVLPPGYCIALPTEAEWEAMASYDATGVRRRYPWGDTPEPTVEHANYDETGIGAPSPVGLFPLGRAACGALDMVGNVWEWCSSEYDGYPERTAISVAFADVSVEEYLEIQKRNTLQVPTLKGESWWGDRTNVRCGARNSLPVFGNFITGFRVVCVPRATQVF